MENFKTVLANYVAKPSVVGLTAALGSYYLIDAANQIEILGLSLPMPIWVGILSGVGSAISILTHEQILSHIPVDEKYLNLESGIVNAIIPPAIALGSIQFLSNSKIPDLQSGLILAALIAAAEIGGDYVYIKFLKDFLQTTS